MDASDDLARCLEALGADVARLEGGRWALELESAGLPLRIELSVRGPFVRAQALVLPPDVIEPRQLLFWNGQAPLVCFAENRAGEVLVCGELPAERLTAELLDRFLGLLHASATRARQFVLPA